MDTEEKNIIENDAPNNTADKKKKHKKNRSFAKGVICGILICVVVVSSVKGISSRVKSIIYGDAHVAEATMNKLSSLEGIINNAYLYNDDLDMKKLEDGVYKGFVQAVGDPYTVYYTEEETKELFQSIDGEYSGIGAVLSQNIKTGLIVINNVYSDSPAEKGGLKDGDTIIQIGDHELAGEEISEVVTWIRGEKGTDVDITVLRDGKEVTCTVTRDIIQVETVEHEMMDDSIGYLRITEFDDVTLDQFKKHMASLEEEGMKGLVIDLRSNPGGNLDVTVEMLKEILPKGVIVSTKSRVGDEKVYSNDVDNTFDKPLTVLVDGYTASASEIFSGAVKDYGIGTIVGTQTFGKGIVQSILDLGDGTSLKVTVAEYFTPSGENIHGVGITPDVVVEFPENVEEIKSDVQLDKAVEIIKEQLK